ncbi:LacI family DNA-binding transcriptional regulator [Alkalicoccus daliensis]|uniref:Transcriptional regulator, LacI family n=1 Tax=Alkalicoccus daliensis TaxID=745820 RepID=A0A1H0G8B6_9BACI|nr:LacI family DNA-binding transcriptional regulator [Alkalicoccus daliensis]SDO03122.1 transcriptional regulator, LacI family [Alkalicoccus daliensis]
MRRKVTLQDVADHAAVSKSTVSQYLNGRFTYMGEETKHRIEKAVKELKYQPNVIARSLKQKKTTTIGVIMANILHRFSTQTSRAIEDFFHSQGYHVILCNADDDPQKEQQYIEMLKAKQVDGFIIFPTASNEEMYKSLLDENYPLVFLDRKVKALPVPTICLDNQDAMERSIQHLKEEGSERIAYVSSDLTISPRSERYEGLLAALKRLKMPVNNQWIYTDSLEDVEMFLEKVFDGEEIPEAIMASNDRSLMRILSFLKKKYNGIPPTLSLMTIDEVEFAELYSPRITTMEQPAFAMGKKAAEVLLEQINGNKAEDMKLLYEFEGNLNIRESSKIRGGIYHD